MSSKAKQQLMFNTAVLGVIGQGARSTNSTRTYACAYRGENGTKCAVGQLIPDEKYEPIWDAAAPTLIGDTGPRADRLRAAIDADWDDIDILSAIQRAHDSAGIGGQDFVPGFIKNATRVAELYGLEMPNAQ